MIVALNVVALHASRSDGIARNPGRIVIADSRPGRLSNDFEWASLQGPVEGEYADTPGPDRPS